MRLSDEYEKNNESRTGLPVVYMAIGGVSFFLMIVCIVLMMNYSNKPSSGRNTNNMNNTNSSPYANAVTTVSSDDMAEADETDSVISELGQSDVTAEDLDFWNMYKEDEEKKDSSEKESKDNLTKSERYEENAKALLEEEENKKLEDDLSEGGTKTKVTFPDGTEQWVMVNQNIPKNTYDYTGLVLQEPVMRYYEGGSKISKMGVTINGELGEVDFTALKEAGVEYAMIEIASRGYSTGKITYDDKYCENLQKATEAGLDVGVIFNSQAATEAEAEEEAQIILDNIAEFNITYPVVFKMELVSNDTSRIQNLTKTQLTAITLAFCKKIQAAGHTPMIMGNKFWLIRKIDVSLLSNYDFWLTQCEDTPDYPYQFAMWEYTQKGVINGITP